MLHTCQLPSFQSPDAFKTCLVVRKGIPCLECRVCYSVSHILVPFLGRSVNLFFQINAHILESPVNMSSFENHALFRIAKEQEEKVRKTMTSNGLFSLSVFTSECCVTNHWGVFSLSSLLPRRIPASFHFPFKVTMDFVPFPLWLPCFGLNNGALSL